MAKMRLDRLLAGQGTQTRKEVRELIRKGRVTVNGQPEKAADRQVEPLTDVIEVDGVPLRVREHVYLMLHKPQGVVSASEDRHQPTVVDLVPPELRRKNLFPAGRLDKDTEGFVLITDDGAFAHRILAPKNKLPKRYTAVLDHRLDPTVIGEFEKGVDIGGGDHTLPAELTILENGENPRVSVIICEGMYHQIKRMFERFGYQVIYLKREQIGGLPLDPALPKGACRELTDEELRRLEGKEGEDAQ